MTESAGGMSQAEFAAFYGRIKEASRALAGPSLAERWAALPEPEKQAIFSELDPLDGHRLLYSWELWARPKQRSPAGVWRVWLILAGRGFGKSLSGAEWIRQRVEMGARKLGIIGPKWQDVERYMIGERDREPHEGKAENGSRIFDVFPPAQRPIYNKKDKTLTFHTGAVAYIFTAEDEEFRGPNLDSIWADEPVKWARLDKIWDNIKLTLRQKSVGGLRPKMIVTTTPKPLRFLRELVADKRTHTTHGVTAENAANVDEDWIDDVTASLSERQRRQELYADILGDNPGALFHEAVIEQHRVSTHPQLVRVLVCVDNAVSTNRKSDDTGIVVVGLGVDGHTYVVADRTQKSSPEEWGAAVIELCELWSADALVERNAGGDMVASTVRAAARAAEVTEPRILETRATARTGGKPERAEPVSVAYQRGLVHHVGTLPRLEAEMVEWDPGSNDSPNGLDALCWGVHELLRLDTAVEPPPQAQMEGLSEQNRKGWGETRWQSRSGRGSRNRGRRFA